MSTTITIGIAFALVWFFTSFFIIRYVKKQKTDLLNMLLKALPSDTQECDSEAKPFDFIRRSDPANVLDILQQEKPYIIALVLAHLEPSKAAILLSNLPCGIQNETARLIATMDRISLEIVRGIERMIEKKLSSCDSYSAVGGIDCTVEILNLLDRVSEKQIIATLEDNDPELADEIKKRLFVFKDIALLDDRTIQKVLRETDLAELTKALRAADREVQDKIFRNMSKNAAGLLHEEMEFMGPILLREAEDAQQKIISIIRHLEETGEIFIHRDEEIV